jgi:hypothetical protein
LRSHDEKGYMNPITRLGESHRIVCGRSNLHLHDGGQMGCLEEGGWLVRNKLAKTTYHNIISSVDGREKTRGNVWKMLTWMGTI